MPLRLDAALIESIKQSLPELPDQKIKRYTETMGLSLYDASVLVAEKETAQFFEAVAAKSDAKMAANWITVELFARLNKIGKEIQESPVSAAQMSELLQLIKDDTISGKIAKQVFEIMFENGGSPKDIVEKHGLKQVTDTGAIEKAIDEILAQNPDKVAEYKSGKDKLFGFFVGQVMKVTQGRANPNSVNEILLSKLK